MGRQKGSLNHRYKTRKSETGFLHWLASTQFARWCVLLVCLVSLTGCRGCLSQSAEEQKKEDKKGKEARPNRLSIKRLQVEPTSSDPTPLLLKPGHWYQAKQELKANEGDESLSLSVNVTRQNLDPVTLPGSSQVMNFQRDTAIAKGQSKATELLFYVPELSASLDPNSMESQPTLLLKILQRGLGITIAEQSFPGNKAKSEQYAVVLLSKDPPRHTHWSGLSSMVWPSLIAEQATKVSPHRVVSLSEKESPGMLPDRSLFWTTISHVVWYDADPSLLSEKQQLAMVDWLHYGGQLIVSGPDSLVALNNSFLSPYLPLHELRTESVNPAQFTDFFDYWSVPSVDGNRDVPILPIGRQLPMIVGKLADDASWLNHAEGIIAERGVGNGRICMATISLSDDVLVRWKGLGSMVNGALLGHPPRTWEGKAFEGQMRWLLHPDREGDPALSTRLRYLARDAKRDVTLSGMAEYLDRSDKPSVSEMALEEGTRKRVRSIGSWNDDSPVAAAAGATLAEASGIVVPRIHLIIKLLVGYLIILVPLNWLVFRLMGRVEWAWIAAPFLALIGAGVVARSVQLDIGFSRSENRVGCIEIIEGYGRAHQATYTSLYTSLSTPYDAFFMNESGLALPMTLALQEGQVRRQRDRQTLNYNYAADERGGLGSYQVRSNSTGVVHSEEFVELGGLITTKVAFEESTSVLMDNQSKLDLHDVLVCGLDLQGRWVEGELGDLRGSRERRVQLQLGDLKERWPAFWDASSSTRRVPESNTEFDSAKLRVGKMLEEALYSIEFVPGKLVAMGWTENSVSNLNVEPMAVQQNRKSIVVVHLAAGLERVARPDRLLPDLSDIIVEGAEGGSASEGRSDNP